MVVALWVRNRGLQEVIAGPEPAITSVGRLTGLLSADLMLIQVFLMARVPWVERSLGQDRLARWHRLAGFTSFHLLLAHVALTTLGYAAAARTGTAARAGSGPHGVGPGRPGEADPGGIASDGTGPAGDTGGGTGSRAAGGGTFDGSVAQTRWGPVQVRITVSSGRITEVAALQVPDGNFRDQMINSRAVPILRQEALRAQSAEIGTVSGATVTSEGYRESLQAALDAAHLR